MARYTIQTDDHGRDIEVYLGQKLLARMRTPHGWGWQAIASAWVATHIDAADLPKIEVVFANKDAAHIPGPTPGDMAVGTALRIAKEIGTEAVDLAVKGALKAAGDDA